MKPETSSCCNAPVTFYHVANEVPSLWICSNCGKSTDLKVADSRPLASEIFEGERSSLYRTYQDATKPDWTPINMKNEPRLSAEIEKRFDEEISYLLHETVDGDWCPALGIPYFNPLGSTSATKSKPNYRIINPIYKCECGGDEKIAKVKHFLATALESQTAEYVRKIKTMRVVAHGLGFLLDKDEVLDVLTQKKEDR